jgi:hypothetical protein
VVVSSPQPSDEEAPAGCGGWLFGCAVSLLAVIGLAIRGFDFPAGLPDVYGDFQRATNRSQGTGDVIVLALALFASMVAALSAALLAAWLAERFRVGEGRLNLLADVTAAVATVVYFAGLGLLGDSWAWLAASPFAVVFVFFLTHSAIKRLRR